MIVLQVYMYVDSGLYWKLFYYYFQWQIQKVQKGVAGTLAHLPPIRYFLFFWEFYENTGNTKFQRIRGGLSALGPPLNPPFILFSMYNFVKVNLHGMTLLHVMCLPKAYNMSCVMKIKPRTYCLVTDLYTTQLVLQASGKYFPCYKVIACKLAFSFALFSRIFTVIFLMYSYYV